MIGDNRHFKMFGDNDEYDQNKTKQKPVVMPATRLGHGKGTVISGSGVSSGMDCRSLHSTNLTQKRQMVAKL